MYQLQIDIYIIAKKGSEVNKK